MVPNIEPRPPARLAPPRTIAVITSSSKPRAAFGSAADSCEQRTAPASAAPTDERTNVIKSNRLERIPTTRAAFGFEPIAYKERPYVDFRREIAPIIAITVKISTGSGTPHGCDVPSHSKLRIITV